MYQYAVVVLVIVLLWYFSRPGRAEHFDDAPGFSPYGNMGMGDADKLGSEHSDGAGMDPAQFGVATLDGAATNAPELDAYDNSDIVSQLVAGQGPDVFLPNGRGTTSSSYGGDGAFARGEPSYNTPWVLPQTGTNADEMLARKQQHISSANKRAIDGTLRHTSRDYSKYFQNELAENERKEWWGAAADPLDTDFLTY